MKRILLSVEDADSRTNGQTMTELMMLQIRLKNKEETILSTDTFLVIRGIFNQDKNVQQFFLVMSLTFQRYMKLYTHVNYFCKRQGYIPDSFGKPHSPMISVFHCIFQIPIASCILEVSQSSHFPSPDSC